MVLFQNLFGGLSQIASLADALSKIVGLFGYVFAFISYIQQRAAKKAHEETLAAITASFGQPVATAVGGPYAAPAAPPPIPALQQVQSARPPASRATAGSAIPHESLTKVTSADSAKRWQRFIASINHPVIFWGGISAQIICVLGFIIEGKGAGSAVRDVYGYYQYTPTGEIELTIGIVVIFLGLLLWLGFLIASFVGAIRFRDWRWVVGLFLLNSTIIFGLLLGPIMYGLNGPTTRKQGQHSQ